jgi:isopenicillin N synthase-like dioxygenase
MIHSAKAVPVVRYAELAAGSLSGAIKEAYGSEGRGILFVQGTPGFAEARARLLPLIWRLGRLPAQTLRQYERPDLYHSIGWSKGFEKFKGKYDTAKGSFYFRTPADKGVKPEGEYTEEEVRLFTCENRWPQDVAEFEAATKAAAGLMTETAAQLSRHIDSYVASQVGSYPAQFLEQVVRQGRDHIGRVLHYYPVESKAELAEDWCGWHNDHSCLTALMPAAFYDQQGRQFKPQGADGGLFTMTRGGDKVRIAIPEDCMAFQTGETLQIVSGGVVQATPHCVVSFEDVVGKGISRETLAIFHQPGADLRLRIPKECDAAKTLENRPLIPPIGSRFRPEMTFAEFTIKTISSYS